MPAPKGRSGKSFSTYLIAQLFHAGTDLEWRSKTVKTQHTEGEGADVMWQSKFEWEYDIDDMAFLRFVLYYIQSSFPTDFFFFLGLRSGTMSLLRGTTILLCFVHA